MVSIVIFERKFKLRKHACYALQKSSTIYWFFRKKDTHLFTMINTKT